MEEIKPTDRRNGMSVYGEIVEEGLSLLSLDSRQKTVEVCHVAKFLLILDQELSFHAVMESPDFILKSKNGQQIGLEHEVLLDTGLKQIEGSFENLFSSVEGLFREKYPEVKLLLNVSVNTSYRILKRNIKRDVNNLIQLLEKYIFKNEFCDSEIVHSISSMSHVKLSISCNTGAWWGEKNVDGALIDGAVKRKTDKVETYKLNSKVKSQWLLIVIGGARASSYEVGEQFSPILSPHKFERIYILEDFNSKLYRVT